MYLLTTTIYTIKCHYTVSHYNCIIISFDPCVLINDKWGLVTPVYWHYDVMFILCTLALMTLNKALLKVLQIFFDNFLSDFRGQEVTCNRQTCSVDYNNEILQFNISALYKLQLTWMTMFVCSHSQIHTHNMNC